MRKSVAILAAFCILLSGITVFGADIAITAAENAETFQVDIDITGLEPLSTVAVVAALESSDPETAVTHGSAVYIGQEIADRNGNIKTSIGLSGSAASGDYVITVTDERTGESRKSAPFVYRSKGQVENALIAVNGAAADSMTEVLEKNGIDLLLDMTEYNAMNEASRRKVADMLCRERPTGGFAATVDVQNAFSGSVAAVAISGAADPEQLLRKYAENLKIDITALNECEEKGKAYALGILTSNTYDSPDKLTAQYEEAIFAGVLYEAKTAGELQDYYLNRYADVLKPDLTAYNKLSNPTKVFAALLGAQVTGYQDAADRFEKAVAAQALSESKTANGGAGGGGGFSSGGYSGGIGFGGGGYPASGNQDTDNTAAVPPSETINNDPSETIYNDLNEASWAREYILYLNDRGIISGDGDGSFRPNSPITRAEFLKMLIEAFGIRGESSETAFEDVKPEDWYSSYVGIGVRNGIVNGVSETWFGADDSITRQDLTVMCDRALEYLGLSLTETAELTPADAEEISDYASDAVFRFYGAGILNGDTDGRFRPEDGATRAEAAKIIAGLMNRKEMK